MDQVSRVITPNRGAREARDRAIREFVEQELREEMRPFQSLLACDDTRAAGKAQRLPRRTLAEF